MAAASIWDRRKTEASDTECRSLLFLLAVGRQPLGRGNRGDRGDRVFKVFKVPKDSKALIIPITLIIPIKPQTANN